MAEHVVDFESPLVQSYLAILQSVITRMATNSASCKTWCVSLVSAIVVILADKGKPSYVWISVVPLILFLVLDAYYLALERQFRDRYNEFIRKLHFGTASVDDVFIVLPKVGSLGLSADIAKAAGSIAVWPFYGLLALMLLILRAWIL
jgi:hypothetical protein